MSIEYVQTEKFYIEKYTIKTPMSTMHYHHAYELYYILEGEREYFIGDSFFSATQGDLVWVPADSLHRTEGKGATRLLMYFKKSFIQEYFSNGTISKVTYDTPFVFRADAHARGTFENMFFDLLKEFNKGKIQDESNDEFLIAKLLFEILFFIFSHENCYKKSLSKPNERMHTIIKYINDNYSNQLSIQEVADEFGITKDHLCHVFPKYIGVTFVTYLNVVRIKAACEMMKKEQDTISDIAIKCGFSSSHYFCKVFKSEKGMSPSEYRAQFKTISSKLKQKKGKTLPV